MSDESTESIAEVLDAPGVGCFDKGTPVWSNRGLARVETLRPGDRILVVDAATGAEVFRPVTETFDASDTRIVSLAMKAGEMIAGHPDQPFRLTSNEFKAARDVEQDAVVVTAGGGRAVVGHNVQIELKSPEPNYGIRVAGALAVFVGRQGLMAAIADVAREVHE